MSGFVKKSTILATVLLSATFAYAGDLRPAPQGGNNMHPAPQGPSDPALQNGNVTNETAIAAISKEKEDKLKLRRLRPAK